MGINYRFSNPIRYIPDHHVSISHEHSFMRITDGQGYIDGNLYDELYAEYINLKSINYCLRIKSMKHKYIRLIHIAKSQLNIDDDTYRHLLQALTKKSSTKMMTIRELEKVLDNLKSKGFKVKPPKKAGKITATEPVHKKIRSLWLKLADAGKVKNRSEKAINSYVKRITGVEVMDWLTEKQAMVVIESLKCWRARI